MGSYDCYLYWRGYVHACVPKRLETLNNFILWRHLDALTLIYFIYFFKFYFVTIRAYNNVDLLRVRKVLIIRPKFQSPRCISKLWHELLHCLQAHHYPLSFLRFVSVLLEHYELLFNKIQSNGHSMSHCLNYDCTGTACKLIGFQFQWQADGLILVKFYPMYCTTDTRDLFEILNSSVMSVWHRWL